MGVTGGVGGSGSEKKNNQVRSAALSGLRRGIARVPTDVCQMWIPDIRGTLQRRRCRRSRHTPASKADEGERGKEENGAGEGPAEGGVA